MRVVALATLGIASLVARSARADLPEEAGRVATAWQKAGGQVTRAEPHFVTEGDSFGLDVGDTAPGTCLTVAMVGARGVSFHV